MKFKVGDKVRVVSDCYPWKKGEILVIKQVNDSDYKVTDRDLYIDDIHATLAHSLPINITFKNRYEHQAVQQFLFDNGCAWCNGGETTPLAFGEKIIQVTADKGL